MIVRVTDRGDLEMARRRSTASNQGFRFNYCVSNAAANCAPNHGLEYSGFDQSSAVRRSSASRAHRCSSDSFCSLTYHRRTS